MGEDSGYIPIKVPPIGDDGYSDRERDDILRGLARSQNFVGKQVSEHEEEIKGHKGYKGLKAISHESPCPAQQKTQEQADDNTKKIYYIMGFLGIGGGGVAVTLPLWLPLITGG